MKHGLRHMPPSRQNKKQIVAHLDPVLVEAAHNRRRAQNVTVQEILGMAVNSAVQKFGRSPILTIRRDRVVKREKSLAQVQKDDKAPRCRAGKRRLAAWFDTAAVERVAAFSSEVGVRTEDLVDMGLRMMLSPEEIDRAIEQSNEQPALEAQAA
jgi:hypothetical protein